MLLKKRDWFGTYLAQIRQLPEGSITTLQGKQDAETLLLAPIPTEEELRDNRCWTSASARIFFDIVAGECEVSPDAFIVVPLTFTGGRAVASEVALSVGLLKAACTSKQIKRFVCIGGTAFKVYFGSGKKPNMQTVASGIPLRTEETGYKPLFVFPDPEPLNREFPPADARVRLSRADFLASLAKQDTLQAYMRLMPAFKTFMH